jgi:hypothetical protein
MSLLLAELLLAVRTAVENPDRSAPIYLHERELRF